MLRGVEKLAALKKYFLAVPEDLIAAQLNEAGERNQSDVCTSRTLKEGRIDTVQRVVVLRGAAVDAFIAMLGDGKGRIDVLAVLGPRLQQEFQALAQFNDLERHKLVRSVAVDQATLEIEPDDGNVAAAEPAVGDTFNHESALGFDFVIWNAGLGTAIRTKPGFEERAILLGIDVPSVVFLVPMGAESAHYLVVILSGDDEIDPVRIAMAPWNRHTMSSLCMS